MSAVTKQEIVDTLWNYGIVKMAERIEAHGIAPEPKGEEAIAPPDAERDVLVARIDDWLNDDEIWPYLMDDLLRDIRAYLVGGGK